MSEATREEYHSRVLLCKLPPEGPWGLAERFAAYGDAGATWLVLGTIGDDWHAQRELIGEAATPFD